jgi:hypothetical protein
MNRKYRFKQDFSDATLGKIPQGMTATFLSNTGGSCKFRLPNGRQIGVPEKSVLNVMEEMH